MAHRVLVIDDERILADNIRKYLTRCGFIASATYSHRDGLNQFKTLQPHIVLLDLRLGDGDGVELTKEIRTLSSTVKIVLMTAYGNIEVAVNAMKAGANEFLTKPIVLKKLSFLLEDMLARDDSSSSPQDATDFLARIVGQSQAIKELKNKVRALLNSETTAVGDYGPPVLITGETGTGKELLAQAIHHGGKRRNGPFIELNCAALPENLVESELFGHEKGAFTGAPARKSGLFEAASGGTLFLDEIADMPWSVQTKLLKAIEDKAVRPVGATQSRKVDVRIVAATNRPLEQLISENRFRSDLYFRLATVRLDLPPLHERTDDVLLLAEHFLDLQARCYGKQKPHLSAEAKQRLIQHDWPGNVRELRNVLEQAVVLAAGATIDAQHLTFPNLTARPSSAPTVADASLNLVDSEKQLMLRALEKTAWNVTAAAKLLGISRDTLRYRIKRAGIKSED